MTVFRLKFIKAYVDRHGRRRCYFRRPGHPSMALPGEPGSRAFMAAYHAAMESRREINAPDAGSLSAVFSAYYQSAAYRAISPATQRTYRGALDRLRPEYGDLPVRGMKPAHAAKILATLDDKPGARSNLRKALANAFNLAVTQGVMAANPLAGLRLPRKAAKGFRPWTSDDVARFAAKWPTGTRERLALALLLYTGQRRSDVVRMGRQHIEGQSLRVVQRKTGTDLLIPMHPALRQELASLPRGQLTFLQTQQGAPFSPAGFTNWFRDRAKAAGVADGSPHGLRKAAANMLAEAGATANEIMAVTGHKNLSEVTLYTARADQVRLAQEAMRKVEARTKVSSRKGRLDTSSEKRRAFKG